MQSLDWRETLGLPALAGPGSEVLSLSNVDVALWDMAVQRRMGIDLGLWTDRKKTWMSPITAGPL